MADVELAIRIPEEIYIHFLSRYKYQGINDVGLSESGKVGVAIKNGTPLPKGHGRLIDADKLDRIMYHKAFETDSDMQKWDSGCWIRYKMFENSMEEVPPIIEADKKYEAKVITHGKCMICGKELDEGLFFCRECEAEEERRTDE